MNSLLENQIIVVTGGAGLLGREFIKSIVENGGLGVIADVNAEQGKKCLHYLQEELQTDRVDFYKFDITSKESVNALIKWLYEKHGRIDALVNSAYPRNKNYGKKFEEVTYEDFCENINLHLGGYFLSSQQFGLAFKKQGYGNIINVASVYGVIAPRFEIYNDTSMTMPVEYAAIKSAVIHLTRYIAKYYKGANIRANSISPGGILDNQPHTFLEKYQGFSLSKGMLDKTDIQGTLLYLLSDMSKYVNGQNFIVDDGFSL